MWKGILICHKKLYLVAKIHIFSLFSLYFRSEGRSRNSKKERKKKKKKGFCSVLVLLLRFKPHLKLNQKQNNTQTNKPRRQTQQKEKKIKRQKLRKGAVPVGSGGRKRGKVEKWPVGIVGTDESGQWMAQSGRREKE
jgi:hypothetical protein